MTSPIKEPVVGGIWSVNTGRGIFLDLISINDATQNYRGTLYHDGCGSPCTNIQYIGYIEGRLLRPSFYTAI